MLTHRHAYYQRTNDVGPKNGSNEQKQRANEHFLSILGCDVTIANRSDGGVPGEAGAPVHLSARRDLAVQFYFRSHSLFDGGVEVDSLAHPP